jgi:hypothetical protein
VPQPTGSHAGIRIEYRKLMLAAYSSDAVAHAFSGHFNAQLYCFWSLVQLQVTRYLDGLRPAEALL